MNKTCEIARDLMPLCLDDAASEGSRKYVEKHIGECGECSAYYAGMQAALPRKTETERQQEAQAFDQVAHHIKQKQRRRNVKKVLLGALIGIAVITGCFLGWHWLRDQTQEADAASYDMRLSRLRDGRTVVSVDYRLNREQMWPCVEDVWIRDEHAVFLYMLHYAPFRRSFDHPKQNGYFSIISEAEFDKIDSIYVGSGPEHGQRLLWSPGGEIKAASEEMEAYFYYKSLLDRATDAYFSRHFSTEGLNFNDPSNAAYEMLRRHCEALRSLVPEWQPWVQEQPAAVDPQVLENVVQEIMAQLEGSPARETVPPPTPLPCSTPLPYATAMPILTQGPKGAE